VLLVLLFANQSYANSDRKTQPPFKKEYQVVVMLPFCIGMPEKAKVREVMLEFYEGIEMAVNEMDSMGMKMNLIVLDTKQDSALVIEMLKDPILQKTDLFFGPVFDNELVEVQKFCAIYKIPMVSPLRYFPNIYGADFPLINCNAVDTMQYYYLGQRLATGFKGFQTVIVENMGGAHSGLARNFKKGYENNGGKWVRYIDGKTVTPESIWNGKDSMLLFYTGKGTSLRENASSLKKFEKTVVMAPIDWLIDDRVNSNDYKYMNGFYFYDPYILNQSDTSYKIMRKSYRNLYGGDPEKYTIIGYDQFQFFCMALMAWDQDFYKHILDKRFPHLHRTFEFTLRGNMIENAGTNIYYYDNYNLNKAFWRY
jgi:ABC-type branched-subunit amino acid transport system substrate-binding protein